MAFRATDCNLQWYLKRSHSCVNHIIHSFMWSYSGHNKQAVLVQAVTAVFSCCNTRRQSSKLLSRYLLSIWARFWTKDNLGFGWSRMVFRFLMLIIQNFCKFFENFRIIENFENVGRFHNFNSHKLLEGI